MLSNDSRPSEFAHCNSYRRFAWHVHSRNRYIRDSEAEHFLQTIRATSAERIFPIPRGTILYRAQLGLGQEPDVDEHANSVRPTAFGPARMKPDKDRACEGRTNPSSMPVLYLSSSAETAVAEVRPWTAMDVSVATFKVNRDLKAVSTLTPKGNQPFYELTMDQWFGKSPVSATTRNLLI